MQAGNLIPEMGSKQFTAVQNVWSLPAARKRHLGTFFFCKTWFAKKYESQQKNCTKKGQSPAKNSHFCRLAISSLK